MRLREFRLFAAPGFTARQVVAAVLEQGWPEAANVYEEISVRRRKGWREIRFCIGAKTSSVPLNTTQREVQQ